jgi:SAM-dependent methyltransferase
VDHDDDVALYEASYDHFASRLHAEIRRAAFGEDIGQTSWLSADEQDRFIGWLALRPGAKLLDVACGSGGPTLRIARATGATVVGVDVHAQGIAKARAQARAGGQSLARFEVLDASMPLPFADASFDALVCIDAINHLPDRQRVLADWRRVLVPGGRLVFTDPIVITGPLSDREMRIRSSIGFFLFVPAQLDELLLAEAGFEVERVEDRTENMARMAHGWLEARRAREAELRAIEGDETFAGQQQFLEVASQLAAERRLSRFAFLAVAH